MRRLHVEVAAGAKCFHRVISFGDRTNLRTVAVDAPVTVIAISHALEPGGDNRQRAPTTKGPFMKSFISLVLSLLALCAIVNAQ